MVHSKYNRMDLIRRLMQAMLCIGSLCGLRHPRFWKSKDAFYCRLSRLRSRSRMVQKRSCWVRKPTVQLTVLKQSAAFARLVFPGVCPETFTGNIRSCLPRRPNLQTAQLLFSSSSSPNNLSVLNYRSACLCQPGSAPPPPPPPM